MEGRSISKVLIASSAELKEEREKCILVINQLNDSSKQSHLEKVEWEYDMVHSNTTGHETIQTSIYPKFKECDLVLFLLSSKMGSQTLKEFENAITETKRIWVFYNNDIRTDLYASQSFKDILKLRSRLPDILRIVPFKDLTNLENKLKRSLFDYMLPSQVTTRRKRVNFPGIGGKEIPTLLVEPLPPPPAAVESAPVAEPMETSAPKVEQVRIDQSNHNLLTLKLKKAFRQLDIPRPMKMGKTFRVKLSVAQQQDQLTSTKDTIDIKEIEIANQVKVTLVGEKFNILSLNNSNQKLVTDNQPSEWNWDVIPKSSGIQKLVVILSIIINIPNEGNTEQEIKLSEETVKVLVNIPYSTVYIIKTYWQWVIGLLAGTGVLWKVIDYFSKKK